MKDDLAEFTKLCMRYADLDDMDSTEAVPEMDAIQSELSGMLEQFRELGDKALLAEAEMVFSESEIAYPRFIDMKE
jgi:hypothetical protein